ncbi:kinase-like domain-containing protein [Thamnidium elegans]|nr:kinase-like domain-containing protein [Thamnidium elegans]
MDSRGIPIVLPGNKYSSPRRNTKLTPLRPEVPSSPFILPSGKNEPSLLEVYDSFADACFQSHFNHSILNEDTRYNVLEFYKSEICPTDSTPLHSTIFPPRRAPVPIETTFESRVPELQDSQRPTVKPITIRSSTFSEEGTGIFESPQLEYIPAVQNTQETIKQEISTDAQLIDFSDMALNTIENMSITDQCNATSEVMAGSQSTVEKCDTDQTKQLSEMDIRHEPKSSESHIPRTRKRKPVTKPFRLTRSQRKLKDQELVSLPNFTSPVKKPRAASKATSKKDETPAKQTSNKDQDKNEKATQRKNLRKEMEQKEIKTIIETFPGLPHYYEFLERAGRGTFSKVYKAKDLLVDLYVPNDQKDKIESSLEGMDSNYVAIKLIFDISSPLRIAEEIQFLTMFRESPCITPLITAFRHEPYTYLVLPYIDFDHFDDFYNNMSLADVRSYISQLLIGLECVHKKSIIHRDVKPGNFLYNNKTKIGYLADFGLAQQQTLFQRESNGQVPNSLYTQNMDEPGHYINDQRPHFHAIRSGTKGFRAPEVLLKYLNQTTAIDIWAVGVILLVILSGRYPFFNPEDDPDAIIELAHLFGMKKLKEFVEFYGRSIQTNIPDIPEEEIDLTDLCRIMNKENVDKWDPEEFLQATDLLKHCLVLIHTNRYTATAALSHPFFKK